MRAGLILTIGGLALALAACEPAEEAADAPAGAPAETQDAAAPDGTGLAFAEAQREGYIAYVAQDTETCFLPDGVEREAEAIDVAPGVGAVIVLCSQGMPDRWHQLFIAQDAGDEGGHPMAVPLVQYDIQGDGQWRAEAAQPNLEWDADRREFVSTITQGGTGCGTSTRWRWDAEEQRIALVEQTTMDCDDLGPDDQRPDPRVVWPTDPATPEPDSV